MPITIASVLGFIPTNIWRPLKKWITKDNLIVFDIPFKLSTKYTPALLIVMMCLSFANQFVRNIEIDCQTSSGGGAASGGRSGYGGQGGGGDSELNDFCWNHETFLVARALQPDMRGLVTYPGVSGYNKGKDELVRQRYYKQVWLILCKLAVLAFLPYFLWKFKGTEKMKALIEVSPSDDSSEEDMRVGYFLETLGFNNSFAYAYLLAKILAAVTPFLQWYYLNGFMGKLYKLYGWNAMVNFMDDSDPWPSPMDALFPKMAKCEWTKYGYGGDIEVKSAQCQLPMNNLTQWSFFIFWWWTMGVLAVNIVSMARLLFLFMFPCYRTFQYRSFVHRACKQDVEKARTYTVRSMGQMVTRRHKKSDIVIVNLSFGDWLVLSFLKRNLAEWQFREFIRKLVVTENEALQLRPMPSVVNYEDDGDDDTINNEKNLDNKANNMEIGWVLNGQGIGMAPPTYSACETASTDCELNPDEISPTPSPNNGLASMSMLDTSGIANTSLTQLLSQTTINITPPVKIDRSLQQPHSAHKKKPKSSGREESKMKTSTPMPSAPGVPKAQDRRRGPW